MSPFKSEFSLAGCRRGNYGDLKLLKDLNPCLTASKEMVLEVGSSSELRIRAWPGQHLAFGLVRPKHSSPLRFLAYRHSEIISRCGVKPRSLSLFIMQHRK